MVAVAGAVPEMTGRRARRAAMALARIRHEPEPLDPVDSARAQLRERACVERLSRSNSVTRLRVATGEWRSVGAGMAAQLPFEDDGSTRARRRAGAARRCRRLRRAARPAARSRAPAEGRSHRISILALAEQYLVFIEEARALRLELAADYLVMAAWLAYLKSRLLLPEPPKGEEPSAADLAAALALRLRRLEAIRAAAAQARLRATRLGRDVFARGAPEAIVAGARPSGRRALRSALGLCPAAPEAGAGPCLGAASGVVWSLVEAREALRAADRRGRRLDRLDGYLTRYMSSHGLPVRQMAATVRASALSARLEMVARRACSSCARTSAFAPLYVRRRSARPAACCRWPAGTRHDVAMTEPLRGRG